MATGGAALGAPTTETLPGALYPHMLPPTIDKIIDEWLEEDISSMDVGGQVVGNGKLSAVFYAKSALVLAGVPFVEAIWARLGVSVEWEVTEGAFITAEMVASGGGRYPLGKVSGPVNRILQGERTALEVLVRSSAIATRARVATERAKGAGFGGVIAGTRKTTPGRFRLVEKYALLVGGVDTHRYSLSAMVMLKDNHVDASGSITKAVETARRLAGFSMKIEVECRSLQDAEEACAAGADVIMLDNFQPHEVPEAAKKIKSAYPSVLIELSGGITPETVAEYVKSAGSYADVISMGCLTQGVPLVDISLKIVK